MTVAVRGAAVTDAAAIAGPMTQLGYPATGDDIGRRLGCWLRDRASRILLAVRGDQVLGCASLHAVPSLERAGRWARIESFVVRESARGGGIGSVLLAAAEDLAREWGCVVMEAASARSRAGAHAFCQQAGYVDCCPEPGFFRTPPG